MRQSIWIIIRTFWFCRNCDNPVNMPDAQWHCFKCDAPRPR